MDFGEAVRTCLTKYATFEGRASRSEYWWFQLFFILFEIAGFMVLGAFKGILGNGILTGILSLAFGLALLGLIIPGIAVLVRRLHDTNRSGWFYWISLIPFVGGILVLIWFCSRGTSGPNTYGDDPLAEGLAETFR